MAKAVAVIADTNVTDDNKVSLAVVVGIVKEGVETIPPLRLEIRVLLTGSENASQKNSAVDAQVKISVRDAYLVLGFTLLEANIDVQATKFS